MPGLGKMQKPKPKSKNFLLLLFGKNYGIYVKRLITGYLPDGYLPGIYLNKYLTGIENPDSCTVP